ncbi:MAG: hypothetical protein A3E83_08145 [Gammaproteobacteria bacterium RIFCSPHIGHO2_12_FULL_41_20]|nr:MAG: hypothetical protein A3E83_08145 [Gammaproteobacteria bacterium RIFCSPHIGHO2_12_FULL_41_20]
MEQQAISPHLRWACRRGMLELDIVLTHFLENGYCQLLPEEQELFALLLTSQDQDLFRWIFSNETQPTEKFQAIIEKIRFYALSRFSS